MNWITDQLNAIYQVNCSFSYEIMSPFKKLPWFPLFLFWLTYSVVGWMLSMATSSWSIWFITLISIMVSIFLFTSPIHFVSKSFSHLLQSDLNAFVAVILLALLAVLMLCWIEHSIRLFVILSATFLARLELQSCHYSPWSIFGLLSGMALIGFCSGLFCHQLLVINTASYHETSLMAII